jgi:hypothetical protein
MTGLFSGSGGSNGQNRIPVRQACTVLYDVLPPLDAEAMQAALAQLVGPCLVEWTNIGPAGTSLQGGMAQFGSHKVAMVALNAAVRPEVLDVTVGVSPMPDDKRQSLLSHGAAIRLLYIGDEPDPIDQLTALYQVAGVLLQWDGLGIINERAALAQPTELVNTFLPELDSDIPPISLWTGVVTFSMGDAAPGRFLVRTYGMDQCTLPELAIYIGDRSLADDAYHALLNVCLYIVQGRSGLQIGVGDRVEFKERIFLLTDPGVNSPEFASDTGLLLLVEV